MLHVALAGLIAGSLALTPPDGTGDDKKNPDTDKPTTESVATPGVFETANEAPQSVTVDTYAMGRPVAAAPIKLWVQYAWGKADEIYDRQGESQDLTFNGIGALGQREAVSQRVAVGAQINFLSLPVAAIGVGAQLNIAKNSLNAVTQPNATAIPDLESSFGLQQVKVYGTARGRVLGIHGGYAFDLGDQQTIAGGVPTDLSASDGRDAIYFGADFDYPSERFRLFGGIDYYALQSGSNVAGAPNVDDGGDYLNYTFGTGFRFGIGEIGAAFQLQTRFDEPTLANVGTADGIGSHIGTVVPYLRISPPSLPASIYVKGATPDEYFEYGLGIGGSNSVKPKIGVTAGLSIGFN